MNLAYRNAVLAMRPWGYWPLDDKGLSVRDLSGNARTGTWSGPAVAAQAVKSGLRTCATAQPSSTGTDNEVALASTAMAFAETTICWWQRVTDFASLGGQAFGWNIADANNYFIVFNPFTDSNFYWDHGNGTTARTSFAWQSRWTNAWAFFMVSGHVAKGRMGVWVNGQTLVDASATPITPSGSDVPKLFDVFRGQMADMAVFQKEYRGADAQRLYRIGMYHRADS